MYVTVQSFLQAIGLVLKGTQDQIDYCQHKMSFAWVLQSYVYIYHVQCPKAILSSNAAKPTIAVAVNVSNE